WEWCAHADKAKVAAQITAKPKPGLNRMLFLSFLAISAAEPSDLQRGQRRRERRSGPVPDPGPPSDRREAAAGNCSNSRFDIEGRRRFRRASRVIAGTSPA